MSLANGASDKVTLLEVETGRVLVAQYNPKEVQIEKSAEWAESKNAKWDKPDLEFTSGASRTMSLELMFDTFEDGGNVHTEYVDKLVHMISVMDPDGREASKRPPQVKVLWGAGEFPPFTGVVQSVSTKYTLFLPNGRPVRATCSVKFKESFRPGRGKSRS